MRTTCDLNTEKVRKSLFNLIGCIFVVVVKDYQECMGVTMYGVDVTTHLIA